VHPKPISLTLFFCKEKVFFSCIKETKKRVIFPALYFEFLPVKTSCGRAYWFFRIKI